MIAHLNGTLAEVTDEGAVVDVGGVGYKVALSENARRRLPPVGADIRFLTEESVAMYGGGVKLYGFPTAEERKIFLVLRDNVPNTGAKKALDLLDKAMKSLPDFRRAVMEKDARVLVSLFGFTAKTAEKMVSALDGKMDGLAGARGEGGLRADASVVEEAVAGLVALGYREMSARPAAQSAERSLGGRPSTRDIIRECLRHLSGRN